jgi:hypothetical protein
VARRVSIPTADDLFRPTAAQQAAAEGAAAPEQPVTDEKAEKAEKAEKTPARPSGRVRHDEKMTVYLSSAELMAIEQARLRLRGEHGLGIDRGRLVREAVAMVLADFEEHGESSDLVTRLVQE